MQQETYIQTLPSGFSFEMIRVEKGSFRMGSEESDKIAFSDEKPLHPVTIESDFSMGKFPITQALWMEVMNGENPSWFIGKKRPVENVSWYDAIVFCNRLSDLCGLTPVYYSDAKCTKPFGSTNEGYILIPVFEVFILQNAQGYRLPSEAEWEYAAKGGKDQKDFLYSGSDKLDDVGWYDENSYSETKPVGLKLPNTLGFHDMSGNVWEWCNDHRHPDYKGAPDDGSAWIDKEGVTRVLRGGSWHDYPQYCRVSSRFSTLPSARGNGLGFRLVLVSLPG